MLFCSGRLNPAVGGPPVVPPLENEELTGLFGAKEKWRATKDAGQHTRRSVYLLARRTFAYPMLATFDPPEVMTSCARRMQSAVPAQALTLLNSPQTRRESVEFARRLLGDRTAAPNDLIRRAWLLAFARPPTASEVGHAIAFLKGRLPAPESATSTKRELAWADFCLAIFNANEFVYID
jgi:hypothetical protein